MSEGKDEQERGDGEIRMRLYNEEARAKELGLQDFLLKTIYLYI
jgi:hypothetical protein